MVSNLPHTFPTEQVKLLFSNKTFSSDFNSTLNTFHNFVYLSLPNIHFWSFFTTSFWPRNRVKSSCCRAYQCKLVKSATQLNLHKRFVRWKIDVDFHRSGTRYRFHQTILSLFCPEQLSFSPDFLFITKQSSVRPSIRFSIYVHPPSRGPHVAA